MQTALAVERAWVAAIGTGRACPRRFAIFALSLVCALLLWTFLAWWVGKPAFLPVSREDARRRDRADQERRAAGSRGDELHAHHRRLRDRHVDRNSARVGMGSSQFVRAFIDPYVEFFRFIPPIAFVTLAVIWFGLGETSKIVLIVYTTLFMVAINTMIGVLGVEPDKRFAALCLGATERQVFVHVTIPAVIPTSSPA